MGPASDAKSSGAGSRKTQATDGPGSGHLHAEDRKRAGACVWKNQKANSAQTYVCCQGGALAHAYASDGAPATRLRYLVDSR